MRSIKINISRKLKYIVPAIAIALFASAITIYAGDALASKTLFKHFVNKSNNNGYWAGRGAIITTSGDKEILKCRATYFLSNSGDELKQNLRCASESYSIRARSKYRTKGEAIEGDWIEETFNIRGNVSGKASGKKMQISVRGDHVNAEMSIVIKKCSQEIRILPKDAPIKEISMQFGRC